MILYALKSGDDYLKKMIDSIEKTSLQKASVFTSINDLIEFYKNAEENGHKQLHCMQLDLSEKEIFL